MPQRRADAQPKARVDPSSRKETAQEDAARSGEGQQGAGGELQHRDKAQATGGILPRLKQWGPLAPFLVLDRRIWLLALARSINTGGFSLVMPFMAIHLVQDRGTSGAIYGFIYLLSGLIAAVGQGIAGELSDRIGRRSIMLSGLVMRSLNMAGLGFAVLYEASIAVLGGLVVLNGLLRAQFEPAASAAVTELAGPKDRVAAFGLQRIGVNVGWAIGPALGGFLATHSYGTLFFAAAPATLLAIFVVLPVKDLKSPEERARERALKPEKEKEKLTLRMALDVLRENRVFTVYLGLVLMGSLLTVQIFSTLSLYASAELAFTKADVGLLYTINGLFVILFQVPAVSVVRAWGMGRALVLGALLYAVAYLGFGISVGFAGMAIGMMILTAGEVIFAPALTDAAATLGDPERMGRAFGLFGLVQTLGFSLGPLFGGVAFDLLRSEPLGLWGLMAGGMIFLAAAYARFGKTTKVFQRMEVT